MREKNKKIVHFQRNSSIVKLFLKRSLLENNWIRETISLDFHLDGIRISNVFLLIFLKIITIHQRNNSDTK